VRQGATLITANQWYSTQYPHGFSLVMLTLTTWSKNSLFPASTSRGPTALFSLCLCTSCSNGLKCRCHSVLSVPFPHAICLFSPCVHAFDNRGSDFICTVSDVCYECSSIARVQTTHVNHMGRWERVASRNPGLALCPG
jgi:hypothetical protein